MQIPWFLEGRTLALEVVPIGPDGPLRGGFWRFIGSSRAEILMASVIVILATPISTILPPRCE
jgi:hypothetical protein